MTPPTADEMNAKFMNAAERMMEMNAGDGINQNIEKERQGKDELCLPDFLIQFLCSERAAVPVNLK